MTQTTAIVTIAEKGLIFINIDSFINQKDNFKTIVKFIKEHTYDVKLTPDFKSAYVSDKFKGIFHLDISNIESIS